MAIFRTFSQIVSSMIDRLRLTQPNLDTKPGTVSRDLFIDMNADEFDRLYRSLSLVSEKQSPELATGRDLDRWANNFGIPRRSGSPSNGIVVFTTNDITADLPIPSGTVVTARNGSTYKTIGSFVMSSAEKNKFAATANRLRSALDLAGISDSFAIEVPVQATRPGQTGNLSSLQIIESNLADSLRVTNLTSFRDGTNLESDTAFRSRIFAIFSGSNTGTAAGYRNAALSVPGVLDVLIVEPGDSLLLRDGTETIEVNDGTFRILNSGTGGKVDIYSLGSQLTEIVESFIYTDLSGSGNATDERNDITPGLQGTDQTLTSEERRVQAFRTGNLPLQPVNSVVSLIGTSSGILAEKSVDENGIVSGNYELIKDTNVKTGGSPFGFDKVKFISNSKDVIAENITKQDLNSVDALRFSEINQLSRVFQDIQLTRENSSISSADRSILKLNHSPVVTVSRVLNTTTGEVYIVSAQNIDPNTGTNLTGRVQISGKTLPTTSDILSVDYTWRLIYDGAVDYNGEVQASLFRDDSVVDSIDWGVSNGIFQEVTQVDKTTDGFEFQLEVDHTISRVISVFSAITVTSAVSSVVTSEGASVPGVVLALTDESIGNIISVKNSSGVGLYNTKGADGTFSGRTIFLPTDTSATIGEAVTVLYNKIEIFNIDEGDGSFSNMTITLPSEDILTSNSVIDEVNNLFLIGEDVYVKYVAEINEIVPSLSLSRLPINGSDSTNLLLDSTLAAISDSNQPVFYDFNDDGDQVDIARFGPTRQTIDVSGSTRAGRIKVLGTTLNRLTIDGVASLVSNGLVFDLESEITEALGVSSLPTSVFIGRVDSIKVVETGQEYDVAGYTLFDNSYSFKTANIDSSIKRTGFVLPSTVINSVINPSSGSTIRISLLVADSNSFEDLFFPGDGSVSTNQMFGRLERVSVSSGFRNSIGNLVGNLTIKPTSQPNVGLSYATDYDFAAPKEGERITLRYNLNSLISDVTIGIENVRPITADVLVKESFSISVDVSGEVLVNEDAINSTSTIIENAQNAIANLLNTATLGSIIDYSDVISVATGVTGVDSINISLFNETGSVGRRSFIKALDNQNITAGTISLRSVSRKDFRIT
jgi:phage-related baseplate assembly protein